MFEPSHLAAEGLAQAYERLVPMLRRQLASRTTISSLPDTADEQPRERRRS